MKIINKNDQFIVLRFFRGEELVSELIKYLEQEKIFSGWIQGLGAGDEIEFSYYDLAKREFIKTKLTEEFEITSIQGNVAQMDGKAAIHAHITISKKDMAALGGHLHSLKMSGTGEILLTTFGTTFIREFDDETGLNLLKPHD